MTTILDKVFEREKLEPENKKDLPGYYGCVAVDSVPQTVAPIENTPTVNYRRSRRY